MELMLKDHAPKNSTLCLIEPHPYYEEEFAEASENAALYRIAEGSSSEKSTKMAKNLSFSTSPSSLSSPSSSNSDGAGYQKALRYQPEESHSVVNHRGGYSHFPNITSAGGMSSLLAFDQNDYSVWEDNSHSTSNGVPFGWLSPEANENSIITNNISSIQDLGRQEKGCLISTANKRPYTEESTQEFKKQCTSVTKTLKSKSTPSKDPQSIAAKNRRERISERLKILQSLVPNGSKVDLVTMLEKAISYVKFLQLQVKVLATDEFWPAQGAKAPDVSQVKEAIDAILASHLKETGIFAPQNDSRFP